MTWIPDVGYESRMRFVAFISSTDRMAIVLKGHIFIEATLMENVSILLKDSVAFDRMRLGFEQKLNLALALGAVGADLYGSLRMLNAIRNKIAHRLDYDVTEGDVDDLYKALPPRERRLTDAQIASNHVPDPLGSHLLILWCAVAASGPALVSEDVLLRRCGREIAIVFHEIGEMKGLLQSEGDGFFSLTTSSNRNRDDAQPMIFTHKDVRSILEL